MLDKRLMKYLDHPIETFLFTGVRAAALALFAVMQAYCFAYVVNQVFMEKASIQTLTVPLLLLALSLTARPILGGLQEYAAKKTALQVKSALRGALTRYAQADYGHAVVRHGTGTLSTLAVEGVESVDAYFSEFVPQFILVIVTVVVILPVVVFLDGASGVIMALTAPLIPVFMILIGKSAEGIQKKQWQKLTRMNGHLLEILRGMVTLTYFGKHRSQEKTVTAMSEGFRKATLGVLRISFLSAFTLELLATLSTAVVAVSLGLRLLYGGISFLPALTVLLLAPEFYQPLRGLGQKFHAGMNGKIVAEQLAAILGDGPAFTREPSSKTERPALGLPLSISAAELSFAYSDSPASPVLRRVSFNLAAGQSMAITGTSGIGKTTLLKLLLGGFPYYEGSLTLAGIEIKALEPDQVAACIAYVPQNPKVFAGTVLENLLLGLEDPQLIQNHALVQDYAVKTGFDRIVSRLEKGYDTLLGDGGSALSGGETQLLAITRAWMRETPIILMDEPTSAMDVHLEAAIVQAMSRLKESRMLVVAAHRRRTTEICDVELNLGGVS